MVQVFAHNKTSSVIFLRRRTAPQFWGNEVPPVRKHMPVFVRLLYHFTAKMYILMPQVTAGEFYFKKVCNIIYSTKCKLVTNK